MEVEVGVDGDRVADVLRQAKALGQEDEGAREEIVKLAMMIPVPSELIVLLVVVGFRAVDMSHDPVEEVADDGGSSEGRVSFASKDIL